MVRMRYLYAVTRKRNKAVAGISVMTTLMHVLSGWQVARLILFASAFLLYTLEGIANRSGQSGRVRIHNAPLHATPWQLEEEEEPLSPRSKESARSNYRFFMESQGYEVGNDEEVDKRIQVSCARPRGWANARLRQEVVFTVTSAWRNGKGCVRIFLATLGGTTFEITLGQSVAHVHEVRRKVEETRFCDHGGFVLVKIVSQNGTLLRDTDTIPLSRDPSK